MKKHSQPTRLLVYQFVELMVHKNISGLYLGVLLLILFSVAEKQRTIFKWHYQYYRR